MPVPLASRTQEGCQRLAETILEDPNTLLRWRGAITKASMTVFNDLTNHPVRGVVHPHSGEFSCSQVSGYSRPPLVFAFSGEDILQCPQCDPCPSKAVAQASSLFLYLVGPIMLKLGCNVGELAPLYQQAERDVARGRQW